MAVASAISGTTSKILSTGAKGSFQAFGKAHRVLVQGNSSKMPACQIVNTSLRKNPPAKFFASSPLDALSAKMNRTSFMSLAGKSPVSLSPEFALRPALATIRKYTQTFPSPLQAKAQSDKTQKIERVSSQATSRQDKRAIHSFAPRSVDVFNRANGEPKTSIPTDILRSVAFESLLRSPIVDLESTQKLESPQKEEAKPAIAEPTVRTEEPGVHKGNIFHRLFAALFRIKNQTGKELSDLCGELERRTKTIENILQLNGELIKNKGPVDFSKNEAMKKLVDTLRETGLVDLPVGKYTWTEEEKDSLKQQLSFAKERMDRMSQEIQFKLQQSTTEDNTTWETISMIFKRLSQALETVVSNIK